MIPFSSRTFFKTTQPILPAMKQLRSALRSLSLAALGLLALGSPAFAADGNPPERMSYQSYLVDANGNPLGSTNTGPKNYDVIFRIFNDQSASGAGNRVWTEQQTITVDKGYFSILLGEGSAYGSEARPPLSSVFTNTVNASDRFIEMTVKGIAAGGGDSTIAPRVRLLPSAYAFLAKTAVNANNLVNSGNGTVVNVVGSNVGINKGSPASALDVGGTVTATALSAGSATVSGALSAASAAVSGAVSAASVSASGNVSAASANVSGTVTAGTFAGNGTIPVGGIIMWSGSVIPTGWALCDGTGGRPDLRNRFIIGSGNSYSTGTTGGSTTQTLQTGNLPSFSINYQDMYYSENGGSVTVPNNRGSGDTDGDNRGWEITRTASYSGSANSFSILPPYYALAFIMRVQ